MTRVCIIGDGVAGSSAAVFSAKVGFETHIFGKDDTKIHKAYLLNYPGIEQIDGTEFITTVRKQAVQFGAEFHECYVEKINKKSDDFRLKTEDGLKYRADYIILASGYNRAVAKDLSVEFTQDGRVEVNIRCKTSLDRVYAVGSITCNDDMQAVISAGQGATAVISIVDNEREGKPHDFDTQRNIDQYDLDYV
jgi:thioredoxin reductase